MRSHCSLKVEPLARRPLSRIRTFYATNLPIGDFLGEVFYAVWMVVVSLGILGGTGFEGGVIIFVILIAFMVNITWGIIDGFTVMYSGIIERARNDKIIHALQSKRDAESFREGNEALSEGITSVLGPDERRKVLDIIASSTPIEGDPYTRPYRPLREDLRYALGILSIDASLVIPLVVPFLIFSDPSQALYFSRLVATVIFVIVGINYAKHLNRRRWLAALFLGTLCFTLFNLAYLAGW
jgi:hypothetical protein